MGLCFQPRIGGFRSVVIPGFRFCRWVLPFPWWSMDWDALTYNRDVYLADISVCGYT